MRYLAANPDSLNETSPNFWDLGKTLDWKTQWKTGTFRDKTGPDFPKTKVVLNFPQSVPNDKGPIGRRVRKTLSEDRKLEDSMFATVFHDHRLGHIDGMNVWQRRNFQALCKGSPNFLSQPELYLRR